MNVPPFHSLPSVRIAAVIDAARSAEAAGTADRTITALLMPLVVYGLVRLADLVADTAAARLPLTTAAAHHGCRSPRRPPPASGCASPPG